MKKINRIIIALTFLLLLTLPSKAEETTGHTCANNQCISCNLNEDGCEEGVCTAFTCESDDSTPPVAPYITNVEELTAPNSGTSVRIRGYGEANTRVFILIDGQEVHEASVGGDNTFDVTFNPNITVDGEHTVQAYLKDTADNESALSESITLNVDATAPDINFNEIPDFTSFENILISGSTEAGSQIVVLRNKKEVYKTGADENGNFDIIITLEDGENKFTIKATDLVGNESTKDIAVVYDASSTNFLDLVSSDNNILTFEVPEGIIAIEVYKNGELIGVVDITGEGFEYDISSEVGGISDEFEFVGIDATGNKIKGTIYRNTSSTRVMMIILGAIFSVAFLGFIGYLIKTGKIIIPGLRKSNPSQKKFKLDSKKNITPENLRKEF